VPRKDVQWSEFDVIGEAFANVGEQVFKDVFHRQNCWASVNGASVGRDGSDFAARRLMPFKNAHGKPRIRKTQCGRQATDAGSDNDDVRS
jgi:hypothetical protein